MNIPAASRGVSRISFRFLNAASGGESNPLGIEHSSSLRRMVLKVEFQTLAEMSSWNVMNDDMGMRLAIASSLYILRRM